MYMSNMIGCSIVFFTNNTFLYIPYIRHSESNEGGALICIYRPRITVCLCVHIIHACMYVCYERVYCVHKKYIWKKRKVKLIFDFLEFIMVRGTATSHHRNVEKFCRSGGSFCHDNIVMVFQSQQNFRTGRCTSSDWNLKPPLI